MSIVIAVKDAMVQCLLSIERIHTNNRVCETCWLFRYISTLCWLSPYQHEDVSINPFLACSPAFLHKSRIVCAEHMLSPLILS